MATTHVKTVTVFPSDDVYAWSNVDDVTSAAATWLTITQQGATDNWDFVVEENLTYSVRSATCTVTHSNGTTDESFTIDQAAAAATAPSVNMVNVTVYSNTSLIGNGNVTSENGSSLTGRGFWFGADPTRSNNTQYPTGPWVVGNIQQVFNGLTPSTTYYCWAYATNAVGTTYSPVTTQATSTASTYTVSTSLNDTANGCAFVSSDVAQPAGNSPVSPMVSAAGLAGTVVTQEVWIQPEAGYAFYDATGGISTGLSSVVPYNTVVTVANTLTGNGNIKIIISTTIPTSNVTQIFNATGTATVTTTIAPTGYLNFNDADTTNAVDINLPGQASSMALTFEYGGQASDPVAGDMSMSQYWAGNGKTGGFGITSVNTDPSANPKTGTMVIQWEGADANTRDLELEYTGLTDDAQQNVYGNKLNIEQVSTTTGAPTGYLNFGNADTTSAVDINLPGHAAGMNLPFTWGGPTAPVLSDMSVDAYWSGKTGFNIGSVTTDSSVNPKTGQMSINWGAALSTTRDNEITYNGLVDDPLQNVYGNKLNIEQVSTTTTITPTNTFNWTSSPANTSTAQLYHDWGSPCTAQSFTWTGNPLTSADFTCFPYAGMDTETWVVDNVNNTVTLQVDGNDLVNNPQGQQSGGTNGIAFTGTGSGQPSTGGDTGLWTVLTPSCIVYGQPIAMADGTIKLVEDIIVGDVVKALSIAGLSEDEAAWRTWSTPNFQSTESTTIITHAFHGSYPRSTTISLAQGDPLKITHEHPVLSKRGGDSAFRRVDALLVGDDVYNGTSGTWINITNIEIIEANVQTVSLGAETADNYFAQGILVHNTLTNPK
jgi:hypothetical protein